MTLKTSLIITGDSKVAQAAVEELTGEVRKLNSANETAAATSDKLDRAQKGSAESARADAAAKEASANATDAKAKADRDATAATGALAAELREAQAANAALSGSLRSALDDVTRLTGELGAEKAALGSLRAELGEVQTANTALATAAQQAADRQRDLGSAAADAGGGLRDAADAAKSLADEAGKADAATSALGGQEVDIADGIGKAAEAARGLGEQATAAGGAFGDAQSAIGEATAGATDAIVDQDGAIQALGESIGGTIKAMLDQVAAGDSVADAFADNADALAQAFDAIGKAGSAAGQQSQDTGTDFAELGDGVTDTAEKFKDMTGKAGATAAMFAGPVGAAIGLAAAALGPLIEELYESATASEDLSGRLDAAANSADSFGDAQSALGSIIDLTTGKMQTQNAVLVQSIKLQQQLKLIEAERKIAEETGQDKRTLTPAAPGGSMMGLPGGNIDRAVAASRNVADQQKQFDQLRAGLLKAIGNGTLAQGNPQDYSRQVGQSLDLAIGQLDRISTSGRVAGRSLLDAKLELVELAKTANERAAAISSIQALSGGGVNDLLKKPGTDRPANSGGRSRPSSSTPRQRSADAGRSDRDSAQDAEDRIASITVAFSDTPPVIRQVDGAIRQIDSLIADLSTKKPIDWERVVAGAVTAKDVVRDAVNKPLDDFLRQADEQSQIQNLLIAGREAEAEALGIILELERRRGPLTEAQKDTVRDTVIARRAEAAELERTYRRQQVYLDLLHDSRDAIEDAVQAWQRGDLREILRTPGKIIEAYQQAKGSELFQGLFGDAFAELERALTEGPVDKASRRMAGEMDVATAAVARLGKAATGAATEVQTGQPVDGGETVVTGERPKRAGVDSLMTDFLTKTSTRIADVFTSTDTAGRIGRKIGEVGGKAIAGAATGGQIAGIAGFLGIKGYSGQGSQIGGALGSLTGIPGGDILGSIAGGLIGNLIKGPTRSGYSSIGTDAAANATTGVSGGRNSAGRQQDSLGYAGAVMDGLEKIAGSLGGTLGANLNLGTIGSQNGKFVFDSDGAGAAAGIKVDTAEEAVRAALSSAISKGAVAGLSEAVRKALGSSSDVDKALSEALKVKQLETLLGGVAGKLQAAFGEFDTIAAERVRLAKTYGLDLLAVEKKNAEERSALLDQTLKARVGSLQSMLDDMRYGDLFEGDASTRRTQILGEIADARQDAAAGVEGSGDRLAELYRLLIETSKEAFGTAGGELAADRKLASEGAAAVIKFETDRINAAAQSQAKTTTAVEAGNALLDEMSDQLAVANARLQEIAVRGGGSGVSTGLSPVDYAMTKRSPSELF